MIKGISFPIKKDIFLKKGDEINEVTDDNKFWLEVNGRQISLPRGLFKVPNDDKLYLIKNK